MIPELALGKLPASWMLIVVVLNLRVAIKAKGNAVLEAVVSPFGNRPNVVGLNPDAAELMAYATAACRGDKRHIDNILWEAHLASPDLKSRSANTNASTGQKHSFRDDAHPAFPLRGGIPAGIGPIGPTRHLA